MTEREERLARFMADIFHVRIVDVTREDVLDFLVDLRKHGLVLVRDEGIIR